MKKLTKIIAMTLAVLMLAAMTVVTCGAASTSTGTVTVDQAVVGETVKFYRVLDYVDTTGSYEVTSDFKTFFDGEGCKTNDEIIAYLAGVADGADSQALAVKMGTFVKNNNIAAAAEKVAATARFTVTDMPYGYYLMAPSLPGNTQDAIIFSLGKLENANVTITNKLSVPTPEKTVSDSDEKNKKSNIASIKEEMTFTVTGKVPNMSEYTTYYFEIADTMTNMEYVGSMELTIGGAPVDISTTDSTANVYGEAFGNSVNVKIKDLKSIASAAYDAEIKLTYNAKLTESAVMGNEDNGNINEVKYIYSNNPATDGTGESPTSKTKTFTLGITLKKTNSEGNPLTGSKWLLKKDNVEVAEIDGESFSKFDWKRLDVGTYTLTETAAPENYTKMEGTITIVIAASVSNQPGTDGTYPLLTYTATVTGPQGYVTETGQSGYANIETGITSLNVKNFENGELPTTGGVGLYVILGLAGAAFAGMVVVIIIKKRMSAKEK